MALPLAILAAAVPLIIVAAALFGMPGIIVVAGIAIPLVVVSLLRARRVAAGEEPTVPGGPDLQGQDLDPSDVPIDLRDQWGTLGPGIGDGRQAGRVRRAVIAGQPRRRRDPFGGLGSDKKEPYRPPARTTGR